MNSESTFNGDVPAESVFVAVKALHGLHSQAGKSQVLMADIVQYVTGAEDPNQKVATAVKLDLRVRRQLQQVLQHQRLSVAPAEALAQDAAEIEMRIGEGFRILFRPSRADSNQIYVVLELGKELEIQDGIDMLVIAQGENDIARIQFTSISGGHKPYYGPIANQ